MREVSTIVANVREKYAMGIFQDFTAAFDRLWWPGVLAELKRRQAKREAYDMLKDYLSRRSVELRISGNSIRKDVNLGCPQGSILGPQLWELVFDDCVRRINDMGYDLIAYADDAVIIIQGRSRTDLEWKAMEALAELKRWMTTTKMELSVEKSVMMMLKGSMLREPNCWVDGRKLAMVKSLKYLGVLWEAKWRINRHLDEVTTRAHGLMCSVTKLFRGQDKKYELVRRIYEGLYVAIACYAVGVWGDQIGRTKAAFVRSRQRKTLLSMIKGYRTISTDAVSVLAGVLPLDLEMKRRWAAAAVRREGSVIL